MKLALPEDPWAPFRVILLLLPLACVIVVCDRFGLDPIWQSSPYRMITYYFPQSIDGNWRVYEALLLELCALLIAFHWCPLSRKKIFLTLLAVGLVARFLGASFTLFYFCGAICLWLGFRRGWSSNAQCILLTIFGIVGGLSALYLLDGYARVLAFGLMVMTMLKGYSEIVDLAVNRATPPFCDHFLAWVGGFPCNFVGPRYPYSSFTRSFLARPWWEIAKDGVVLIYAGLAKLVLVYAFDMWKSRYVGIDLQPFRLGPYLTSGDLWAHSFLELLATLLALTGIFQFQQGLCRLFGYDVENQCDKPWLSSSPLDFWKRLTAIDRNYMLKYVFYPTYRVFQSPYLPLFIVFSLLAGSEFLEGHFVVHWPHWPLIAQAGIREAVFVCLFSTACCLQIVVGRRRSAIEKDGSSEPSVVRNLVSTAALWFFLVAFCIQRWVFPSPLSPGPTQIPGRTTTERYVGLFGRMTGLVSPPPLRALQPLFPDGFSKTH